MFNAVNHTLTTIIFLSMCAGALAAEVNLNGIIGNKALLIIDGGKPRWIALGESTPEGVKLVGLTGDTAIFELGGKRQTLKMGQSERLMAGSTATGNGSQSVSLSADGGGHFVTTGQINGRSVRFLVDTGATFVSLGTATRSASALITCRARKAPSAPPTASYRATRSSSTKCALAT